MCTVNFNSICQKRKSDRVRQRQPQDKHLWELPEPQAVLQFWEVTHHVPELQSTTEGPFKAKTKTRPPQTHTHSCKCSSLLPYKISSGKQTEGVAGRWWITFSLEDCAIQLNEKLLPSLSHPEQECETETLSDASKRLKYFVFISVRSLFILSIFFCFTLLETAYISKDLLPQENKNPK